MVIKKLSILLQKGGFSFCVLKNDELLHAEKVKFDTTLDKSYNDLLKIEFSKQLYFNQDYKEIKVALLNNQFNIIPNEYFEKEKDAQKWLEFNAHVFEEDQIKETNVAHQEAKLIYAFPLELEQFLQEKFEDFKLRNASEVFVNSFQIDSDNPQVFVNVHLNQIELLIFKDAKLYFYNIFEVETKEDIVYYILNSLEQLQLDPNLIELYYFGWTLEDVALKMLMNFVRHVMPGTSNNTELSHYTEIQNLI